MNYLSNKEIIEIFMIIEYEERRRTLQEPCDIFSELYPNRNPITKLTVSKLSRKFNNICSLKDLQDQFVQNSK